MVIILISLKNESHISISAVVYQLAKRFQASQGSPNSRRTKLSTGAWYGQEVYKSINKNANVSTHTNLYFIQSSHWQSQML